MESDELNPEFYTGDEKRAVTCYLFLATLQNVLLDHFATEVGLSKSGVRAVKDLSVRIANLFRGQRAATEHAAHPIPAPAVCPLGKLWEVVVLNDPINLKAYVTTVLQIELGLPIEVAQQRMCEVHEVKSSTVWAGPREKAEAYVHALRAWHLNAALRPVEVFK